MISDSPILFTNEIRKIIVLLFEKQNSREVSTFGIIGPGNTIYVNENFLKNHHFPYIKCKNCEPKNFVSGVYTGTSVGIIRVSIFE